MKKTNEAITSLSITMNGWTENTKPNYLKLNIGVWFFRK